MIEAVVDDMRAAIAPASKFPINVQPFIQILLMEQHMIRQQRQGRRQHGWVYQSYHDLILDLGEPKVAPIRTDDTLGTMEVRQCYRNCYEAVTSYVGYTYVEGYAQAEFLPVQHAWLEDENGTIIDPTWVNLDFPAGFLATYMGVRFSDEFVLRHAAETGWSTLLESDWRAGHQVLKRGFKMRDGIATDLGDTP